MSVKISDTIREYLGWCPNAQARSPRRLAVLSSEQASTSPEGGGTSLLPFSWYSEVRVQMFILGILMCAVVLWQTPAYNPMLIMPAVIGAIVAISLSGTTIRGYQEFYMEVMKTGSGDEMTWCRGNRSMISGIVLILLVVGFLFSVTLGWIPGLDLTFTTGFVLGFIITYVLLYLLFLVLWEKRNGVRMYMKWPVYYVQNV